MGLSDCPLCLREYSQLSQHLRVTHGVMNREERKLLLAIPSGRVDVRNGNCPVPGCDMSTSRMDRHLKSHTELTAAARRQVMESLKHRKILRNLAELRASDPAVAMASSLDLHESEDTEEQQQPCNNPRCQREREDLRKQRKDLRKQRKDHRKQRKDLRKQLEDLRKQVSALIEALAHMSRRCVLMEKRSQEAPSSHQPPARPTQTPTPLRRRERSQRRGAASGPRPSSSVGSPGPAVPAEVAEAAEPVQKRQRKQTEFFF
ncbi:uncharacterized protein LOC125247736 isoform X2 [Megalobrama amblycephala]|uniref:uncharacterized protein LOC125247736 isoform X2 n=1 Tax=Megalobrama amblycephala TaxID=75352 RepID=UPI002013FCAF|nr:uncharacterized protein LOC125247736 isoform X2 [Megalobrama amblycephala]